MSSPQDSRDAEDQFIAHLEEQSPDGEFLAQIRRFGVGKWYDLNAATNAIVQLSELDMRTWAGDDEMKFAISEARRTLTELQDLLFERYRR
jgi:hypothetical protein